MPIPCAFKFFQVIDMRFPYLFFTYLMVGPNPAFTGNPKCKNPRVRT